MYENLDDVIRDIKAHFASKFAENFTEDRQSRYVDFKSPSHIFRVHANFIQARTSEDLKTPITSRIDKVLNPLQIGKPNQYSLTSKFDPITSQIEYCAELIQPKNSTSNG